MEKRVRALKPQKSSWERFRGRKYQEALRGSEEYSLTRMDFANGINKEKEIRYIGWVDWSDHIRRGLDLIFLAMGKT